ncbi:hypothetical protein FEQ05_05225 [Burkholderia pseudomultivorans]|uniref:Uncharacterized protein n=1 Tax=Burkholderia pseudomultivorans TaxID=1207504 RepID=A0A6P2Q5G8_9BURK|nr:hypothetical protein [Burkholderia pseudomultivorans]MDR8737645.1 hypothetical protein [Burkholderia pseudomultivorans]MDR8743830.1 hypothetical protein [Burkholderia pseudomultivorans]MDR8755240.1 hypothetical protein [Burkholderia pseudomultivorans]MDR8780365.1 hypothetical protein [Burkholderia pseudomultivorans]
MTSFSQATNELWKSGTENCANAVTDCPEMRFQDIDETPPGALLRMYGIK